MSALRNAVTSAAPWVGSTMEEAAAVWIRDEAEGWLPGVVKKVDDDQIEVDVVDVGGNSTGDVVTLQTQEIKRKLLPQYLSKLRSLNQ